MRDDRYNGDAEYMLVESLVGSTTLDDKVSAIYTWAARYYYNM